MSEMQQSVSLPTEEQPKPPHWPHEAKQHALPLEDSMPGIPPALGHTPDEVKAVADPDQSAEICKAPLGDQEMSAPNSVRVDSACGCGVVTDFAGKR